MWLGSAYQVGMSRIFVLSTVDERRYGFPRVQHIDNDSRRAETRIMPINEQTFTRTVFSRSNCQKKTNERKKKKKEYTVFYIYHMIVYMAGEKVRINLGRSSWCDIDIEYISMCDMVASTIRRRRQWL